VYNAFLFNYIKLQDLDVYRWLVRVARDWMKE
jgi:hypothetical protein